MKNIVVLGSTGSVGKQVMEVLRKKPGYYKVLGISGYEEISELNSQIKEFKPEMVCVGTKKAKRKLESAFKKIKIYVGENGLKKLATHPKAEVIEISTSGTVALEPMLEAIRRKKEILLANKESLIIGGDLISLALKKYKTQLLPLDSEHSAIFQCLKGERKIEIKNLILTCSGGPLRNYTKKKLEKVTRDKVLSHPVWKMGSKITVDSASLMNKGFEVIEAHHLFQIPYHKIKVVVHPECIIHSMVEFQDGTIKALLSQPDMRLPIQYALFHPQRLTGFLEDLDLTKIKTFSFLKPDRKLFPCLNLAYAAGEIGGTMPAVLNFADEIAVEMFLNNEIEFLNIPQIIGKIIKKHQPIFNPNLKEILAVKNWVRNQLK